MRSRTEGRVCHNPRKTFPALYGGYPHHHLYRLFGAKFGKTFMFSFSVYLPVARDNRPRGQEAREKFYCRLSGQPAIKTLYSRSSPSSIYSESHFSTQYRAIQLSYIIPPNQDDQNFYPRDAMGSGGRKDRRASGLQADPSS